MLKIVKMWRRLMEIENFRYAMFLVIFFLSAIGTSYYMSLGYGTWTVVFVVAGFVEICYYAYRYFIMNKSWEEV